MEDDIVKVSIANAESVSDDDSKAYTVRFILSFFKFQVYYIDFEYRGLKWRVTHRYSALFDLATKVPSDFYKVYFIRLRKNFLK
jgi:pantothenate kinase